MLTFRHTEETKRKMKDAWIKRRLIGVSQETRKRLSVAKLGNKNSQGSKCSFWKGGVSKSNDRIRHSAPYKLWRKSVFERDGFTCVWCGHNGGHLNADHIKPFAYFPELRFDINNGRTLCFSCHMKTETWGSRKYA